MSTRTLPQGLELLELWERTPLTIQGIATQHGVAYTTVLRRLQDVGANLVIDKRKSKTGVPKPIKGRCPGCGLMPQTCLTGGCGLVLVYKGERKYRRMRV